MLHLYLFRPYGKPQYSILAPLSWTMIRSAKYFPMHKFDFNHNIFKKDHDQRYLVKTFQSGTPRGLFLTCASASLTEALSSTSCFALQPLMVTLQHRFHFHQDARHWQTGTVDYFVSQWAPEHSACRERHWGWTLVVWIEFSDLTIWEGSRSASNEPCSGESHSALRGRVG